MVWPSLWFAPCQNTVWYVYDLLLVSTLYATINFMICYWSEHCKVWPSLWFVTGQYTVCYDHFSLWFVTGQNTVCYDQVYDLLLVRMLYVTTKFMICYWSEHYVTTKFMICYWSERCMLRPSWWFVTGQNAMCNDQVWVLLLVRMPYVTTKPTICCWSEHCMLR